MLMIFMWFAGIGFAKPNFSAWLLSFQATTIIGLCAFVLIELKIAYSEPQVMNEISTQ